MGRRDRREPWHAGAGDTQLGSAAPCLAATDFPRCLIAPRPAMPSPGRSALPAEAAVELDHALHGLEHELVVFPTEGLEHADEVAGAGDPWAEALAQVDAIAAAAKVVVAARSLGLRHHLQLAVVSLVLDDLLLLRNRVGEAAL